MSSAAGLQRIAPVPTASDFIDLVLNATMRKTPTVIHKNVSTILLFMLLRLLLIGIHRFVVQNLPHPKLWAPNAYS